MTNRVCTARMTEDLRKEREEEREREREERNIMKHNPTKRIARASNSPAIGRQVFNVRLHRHRLVVRIVHPRGRRNHDRCITGITRTLALPACNSSPPAIRSCGSKL